jgi:hypothetical protein
VPYIAPTVEAAHEVSCVQHPASGGNSAYSTATLTILLIGGQGFLAPGAQQTPQGLLVTVNPEISAVGVAGQPSPPAPTSVPLLSFGVLVHTSPTQTKVVNLAVPGTHTFPCPY